MWFEEADLDAPLSECFETLLVETEAGRTPVTLTPQGNQFSINVYLPDGRLKVLDDVPKDRSLQQVVASVAASRPLRAFNVQGQLVERLGTCVEGKYSPAKTLLAFAPFFASSLLMLTAIFGWMTPDRIARFGLFAVGFLVFAFTVSAFERGQRHRQWAFLQGEKAEKVLVNTLTLPAENAEAEVDDVKAEYGALVSDIVYRIECPALFDPQDVVTREFTLALLQWDNNVGVVGRDELVELAARVRSSFVAAKAHAERVGMEYFPVDKRDGALLALKAARLARDEGASVAEREVALARAVELLDGLALYYVPGGDQARRAITGSGPLQLPGRKNT